ncbi:cytochrome P450 307a1-like [Brevipalpus obovatus]|uniref:cytochrome P450 307a1-like n=1 Tax=Brevipalpus obovatus TaxID=246614 RepID=UPI003D9E76D8
MQSIHRHLLGAMRESYILNFNVLIFFQGPHFESWSTGHEYIRKVLIAHTLSGVSTRIDDLQRISEKGIRKFIFSDGPTHSKLNIEFLLSTYAYIIVDYICGTSFLDSEMSCDSKFDSFIRAFTEVHDIPIDGHIVDVFPFLRYFRFFFPSIRKLNKSFNGVISFLEQEAGLERKREELQNSLDKGEIDTDLDTNLSDLLIKKHIEDPSNLSWTKCSQVIGTSIGGFIPIAILTMASLGYLSLNKKYQEKIFQEIQRIKLKSASDLVSLEEARELVHVKAALLETARLMSPPQVPRIATQDFTIKGFLIPKGATILINDYSFNYSPRMWESPESFMPERFIASGVEDGSAIPRIRKPPHFMPYGLGRRYCPGYGFYENLASLVLANIIQRYEISCDMDQTEMSKRGLGTYGSFHGKNFFDLKLAKRFPI